MSARAWSLLLFLSVLWGGSFLFNRIALVEIPTFTLVFARCAIAALLLAVVLGFTADRLPSDRSGWWDLTVMGILNNVIPFVLIVWGQHTIGAGLAAIMNATTPIFSVIIAHIFTTDDKATPLKVSGILLGIIGVAVLIGLDRLAGISDNLPAEIACLGAALSYGLSSLWSRRFRGRPPTVTAAGQLTASSLILLPIALVVDTPWTLAMPSTHVVLAMLGLAALSTALAYVVFFRIITIAGATSATLVTLLVPPSAVVLGWLVLAEKLAVPHIAGMALIFVGLLAIDGRIPRAIMPLIGMRKRVP